jgi:hypothetical protein
MHSNAIRTVSIWFGCLQVVNVRIDWTEVAFHPSYFFLEDFVPESRLEFALSHGCGCNTHGFLPTTKQDLRVTLTIVSEKDDDLDAHRAFSVQWLRYSTASQ